jgi:hypothetical protein
MKPSRYFIEDISSLKRLISASQTWKVPIGIFVRWKVLRQFMRRFCNGIFTKFGNLYTLLDVYNIFEKIELTHAHYEANTMRLRSCLRP